MSLFTSVVPLPYRILAIAALPLAGFAAGWYKSGEYHTEKEQVAAAAEQKVALTAQLQESEHHAKDLQNSRDRTVQLGKDLDAARGLTAGMADRLQRVQAQLRATAAKGTGQGGCTQQPDPEGSRRLQRLFERQQQVLDDAGKCGAELKSLAAKPLCECAD